MRTDLICAKLPSRVFRFRYLTFALAHLVLPPYHSFSFNELFRKLDSVTLDLIANSNELCSKEELQLMRTAHSFDN